MLSLKTSPTKGRSSPEDVLHALTLSEYRKLPASMLVDKRSVLSEVLALLQFEVPGRCNTMKSVFNQQTGAERRRDCRE